MLTRIQILNFAIASEAEVELGDGMTVLTGETGAGKSILIDALDLVLGDRADSGVVRHGAERATINASFTLAENSPARQWLMSQELDDGDECHLRRIISAEGRSKAFINNAPATLSTLKTLGEMLIEIHGQHEHQSLMKPGKQREQLDNAGDYGDLLDDVARLAREIEQCRQVLLSSRNRIETTQAQLELLRYQIQELEALNITELEIGALIREHERISNIDSLRNVTSEVLQQLSESDDYNITQQLGQLCTQLEPWLEASEDLQTAHSILLDASALTEEAGKSIRKLQDRLEADPERIRELDSLLAQLHELARKHAIQIEQLPQLYADKIQQLQQIDQDADNLEQLQQQLADLEQLYHEKAATLHDHRLATAERLSTQVTQNMQHLGMQGGVFQIEVRKIPDEDRFSVHGRDLISYLVSANPGQPLQPLQKVASGGELSRISLAITVICASSNQAPTMIFDEVDSGIGGGVAEIVGTQLASLAAQRQVLCVTHLPQVAAQARYHFRVVKTSSEAHTESRVIQLDDESRVQEIARMMGGVQITDNSLAHARELLNMAGTAQAS
jgi:DNA repair protein RecN (Recombination protein N)